MSHAGGQDAGGASPARGDWDERKIQALTGALISAANAAAIGLSVVEFGPEHARVVFINDVGATILGYPKEVILQRPASSFLSPSEREQRGANEERNRTAPVGTRTLETTVVTSDGRTVPIEVSMAKLELENQPILVTFFRDISARRKSMDALERSEQRFRRLIELAPDAVWIAREGRLLFTNPAAQVLLGYDSIDEVLALRPDEFVHPEDREPMRERTMRMLATGQSLPVREYRVRRRDGSWVQTEVQSMPIDWEGGRAILGIGRDVTFRKEMEADLVRRERLAALGTLLAGIAHEMNNPLSFVRLGVEHSLAALDTLVARPGGREELREILVDVRKGVDRVTGVVRQIRDSSRPDVERRGPVDLRLVLQSALRVVQNEVRHRARLTTELADIPPVDGNAQRLEQVFLNLLVNAIQALPEGRAENEIRVSLCEGPDRQALVEVTDNGGGIASEILPRIFDPFFTTKPTGVGMGLGLSICHGIITSHGGRITVDGQAGCTTFRVSLPLRAAAVAPRPVAAPTPDTIVRSPGRRWRLLVVDDEPSLGEMIRRWLQSECDVDVVTDAPDALTKIAAAGEGTYDLVLCDLMMPGMTGMELYAEVTRRHPGLERLFVFLTGGAFTARASQFLATVKNPCLEKPFAMDSLRALLPRG